MDIRITFLPSLEHIATVKVGLAVFYTERIRTLIDELRELELIYGEYTAHQRVQEKWAKIENQVQKQFHGSFPPSLTKKITGTLRALHTEVEKWKRDHEEFLTSYDVDYESILVWHSEGTINRSKTAEVWIRSGVLDIRQRFLLACTYFMGYDILNLWAEMNEGDRETLFHKTANLAVRFWTDWVREGAIPASWLQIANESLDPANVWATDYHIRLSCFFDKIDPSVRRSYLKSDRLKRKVHLDDLRFCFNHMNWREQSDLIYSDPCAMFIRYLEWPLQNLFPKFLDSIPFELSTNTYHWLISYILFEKIRRGWADADYTEILREIWVRIPPTKREEMNLTELFWPLMHVLTPTKRQPFSIAEILESYF